jgi:glycosyltransferase involved in cell wall biosynthesis/GT2 family glycosyltransferase
VAAAPLVSVLLAVANGERYLRPALESILRQTVSDLELLVVDDGSTDATPAILASLDDPRLRVFRNDERLGLATSLNHGLDEARGRFVARLDADDVAMPRRLERQLARIQRTPGTVMLGTSVCALENGSPGTVHAMPATPVAVSWHLLFSSPFFHPTVLLECEALERGGLRYDPNFLESEDYDLWTRVLGDGEGANLAEALVLYRVHAAQASQSRRKLQRSFQLDVARREIARVAPDLSPVDVELAWSVGAGEQLAPERVEEAASVYVELAQRFESLFQRPHESLGQTVARPLVHAARSADGGTRIRVLRRALELDPALPLHALAARAARRSAQRTAHPDAQAWLDELGSGAENGVRPVGSDPVPSPIRVAAVFPEPTPYRAPLLDRVAALEEVDLTVIYAAETVAGRTWSVEPRHRAVFLRGVVVPGAEKVLHHAYPLTPGVVGALAEAEPDVVVVSGWSTFASQAALAWCRLRGVPYVLVVESHDEGPRAGWRRAVKGSVVPRVVRGASGVLVTGTLARRSMVARGAPPERVHVFANTIDVEGFGEYVDRLAARRPALRESLGAAVDDILVLSVARLAPEKGLDVLVHAVAEAGDPRLMLVLAGEGPEHERLEDLADVRGVRLVLAGDLEWQRIVEVYAAADVFALLSEREPWAVVVNEAAACGLPLVLSDRVGAAHDLLRDGENGVLVPVGDVDAASSALRRLAADRELRLAQGARSRELARDWGYGPSVQGFLAAVREAVAG